MTLKAPLLTVLLATLATASLTHCGKQGAAQPVSATEATTAPETPRTWKQRWEELDLMNRGKVLTSQGKDLANEYVMEARRAFEKLDLSTLQKPVADLLAAIEKGDFALARTLSTKVDEMLNSDVVGKTVAFLEIKVVKGAEDAVKAIDDYLKSPELSAAKREFFSRLKTAIHAPETKRTIEVVGYAICFGCEIQYGPRGAILPALIIGALFNEKDGLLKEYGIFKELSNSPMMLVPLTR